MRKMNKKLPKCSALSTEEVEHLCEEYKINPISFYERKANGCSTIKALRKGKVVDHKGLSYLSDAEMCRAYKVSYWAYKSGRKLGYSLEKALTYDYKVIDCNDKVFKSIHALCIEHDTPYDKYYYRRHVKGMSEEEALFGKILDPNGIRHATYKDMCKHYEFNYNSFLCFRRNGLSTDEAFYRCLKNSERKKCKKAVLSNSCKTIL